MMEKLRELLGPAMLRIAIALSAHAGDSALQRSLEAGFRRHLIKPLDPFGVIEVLQDLLDETPA
jgi:CheY-like chemotaxis protein